MLIMSSNQEPTEIVAGQASWRVATDNAEAYVTRTGGMLAPVYFTVDGRRVQPFSIAPWAEEVLDDSVPAILKALRGDFFCAPFGDNASAYNGETHPPHGESANSDWTLEEAGTWNDGASLTLSLDGRIRPGRIEKRIELRSGETAVYSRHTVSGARGPMAIGHHATLKFPDEPDSGKVSTSPFVYGQVCSKDFEVPENKGYQALKKGAEFTALDRVPLIAGETTDIGAYPARRGYEDLAMIVADPAVRFGWTAVAFPSQGYVWYALKDADVLRNTIFWMSNGGRHYTPWNGRHLNVMGLEETTSNFHFGIADSANRNELNDKGFRTVIELSPTKPLIVNYIMGVAPISAAFDRVARIERTPDGVELIAGSGERAHTKVDVDWLQLPRE